eukprot:GHVS01095162.1.p1 GENE.GHVS01095162.1~~GHVS01095162.1.p1  ORF type:complete len:181 (-),score=24.33 GHVS01095162.1:133-600(-)
MFLLSRRSAFFALFVILAFGTSTLLATKISNESIKNFFYLDAKDDVLEPLCEMINDGSSVPFSDITDPKQPKPVTYGLCVKDTFLGSQLFVTKTDGLAFKIGTIVKNGRNETIVNGHTVYTWKLVVEDKPVQKLELSVNVKTAIPPNSSDDEDNP